METEDIDKMVELYNEKTPLIRIANTFDTTTHQVKREIQQRNVWYNNRKGNITLEQVQKAAEFYAEGMSVRKVADKMDLGEEPVRLGLIRHGFDIRSKSDAFRLAHPVTFNEHVFDDLNAESAYWLGFCLGDSYVKRDDSKSAWQLVIQLAAKDREHLEKFRSFLGTPNEVKVRNNHRYGKVHPSCNISVSSKHMIDVLEVYHIVQNKTHNTKVHESLRGNRDVFRGLVDADGYCTQAGTGQALLGLVGDYDVVSAFKDWASDYIDSKASITKHGTIFRYKVSCNKAKTLMGVLYQDEDVYYLDRKRKLAYELTGRTIPN